MTFDTSFLSFVLVKLEDKIQAMSCLKWAYLCLMLLCDVCIVSKAGTIESSVKSPDQ